MRDRNRNKSPQPAGVPRGGVWGKVARVHAGGTVRVAVESFDRGIQYFGPVPCALAAAGAVARGDQAFLHFDDRGQTAYAMVWPS